MMRRLVTGTCLALIGAAFAMAMVRAEDENRFSAGVTKAPFGKTADGTPIDLYTLRTVNGATAKITNYGAILTELHVPDAHGKLGDVVLGFDTLQGYLDGHPYFGSNPGRVANRVAQGKFALDGKAYTLATNNGPNTLHGGLKGFDKVVWKAGPAAADGPSLNLTYRSPDGEEGFPGNLTVSITYTLTGTNALRVSYGAWTDKATPVNIAHHSYFNLAGPAAGDVLGHEVTIFADKYTPVDATLIPTGKIESVKGTPLDFTTPHTIGERIGALKGDPGGYDHNYVLRSGGAKEPVLAARVYEPKSGRVLEVSTTEPGLQFYTGNFLDGKLKGKGGVTYKKHAGFCLEAQHFPDSVNRPEFPTTILRPGETYNQTTVYHFLTKDELDRKPIDALVPKK
jgi:aldose 1-epimerase